MHPFLSIRFIVETTISAHHVQPSPTGRLSGLLFTDMRLATASRLACTRIVYDIAAYIYINRNVSPQDQFLLSSMAHHDWDPNFGLTHSVVLAHPLPEVFQKLARGDDPEVLERLARLNPLSISFTLLQSDTIAIPTSTPFLSAFIFTLPPYNADQASTAQPKEDIRLYQRQWIRFEEMVPFIPGWPSSISVTAAMVWDEESKQGLSESVASKWGMTCQVRRAKVYEEVDGDAEDGKAKTKVTEVLEGRTAWWTKSMAQSQSEQGLR
jgi:hypothetical protein